MIVQEMSAVGVERIGGEEKATRHQLLDYLRLFAN
jgi:hypothetical protein